MRKLIVCLAVNRDWQFMGAAVYGGWFMAWTGGRIAGWAMVD
jgi:hypothetical protein